MSTIVVHTETEEQEKAVKAALKSLHVSFEDEVDETEYINSSPAMIARIEQAEKDIAAGKIVKVDIDSLWK
ncbi:DUF2683 family protein [Mucilaginibacter phyllosphaerae]|uniref:Uncharacterized protein n=1 Tax=Mucilaginibacter phyllosphaerae TaxID=1812349 RepID=A0A4Y8ACX4_9SPHI|nr:DUF2683 family protein [Mucilaginibacter phyllosphaerae]MBB3970074.1 hypothetical protein [Mucilaginibacter phyllosphaerae]TEW66466.1 hypothetical protein E2R65_08540 [Mucilaginibacter phyllosphaerae]GGH09611.1 hypothetical protein GCM10007352_15060 [Mucilaginibacter phyllosphaerae]